MSLYQVTPQRFPLPTCTKRQLSHQWYYCLVENRITFEHSYNCHGNHWIGIEGHCHDNTTQNLLGPGKLLNCVKNQLHWRGSTQVVEDIKWAEVNQIPGQRRDMGQPLLQRRKNGSLHFVSKRTLLFLLCCSSGSTMCITLCTVL